LVVAAADLNAVDNRKQFWIAHVEAFQATGGSQKHYCERHGLTPRTFRTWRTRIMGGAKPTARIVYGNAVEVREGTKGLSPDNRVTCLVVVG